MSEHVANPGSPERPKKRKLRYPRTSNACNFCRKRKVRCSGTFPCEVCVREEVTCEYANGPPSASSPADEHVRGPTSASPIVLENRPHSLKRSLDESNGSSRAGSTFNDVVHSRRSSIDPPQTFMHGHHVGPTSGISFLYGQWNKGQPQDRAVGHGEDEVVISQAPLISYGDIPRLDAETLSLLSEPIFTVEQIHDILDRYFQYISPTYRFLHHPTVRRWATTYVTQDRQLTAAQKAVVLLVCAQTLLHSPVSPGVAQVGKGDVRVSIACSERAKLLLDKEPGPPSLASVQARIGMCLYFLSTFRLNECRYCFSFAISVATALGIHRRQSSSSKVNILDAECRKRTFWSAYVLDGYLSVMLGRPRLIRDEDVDQPLPQNIADNDLMSSESIDDLPRHGNLEAFIAHSKLAKLMARGNDQLYPLHSLTNDQLLERSNNMLDALAEWQDALPEFLKPKRKTMTGQRTFERQNTILKLAVTHVRILATRRCLLMDFGHADANPFSQSQDARAKRSIQECISAIIMILETIETLIEHGQCYGGFWSTQYVALVAISTLYVLLIQGVRHTLPGDMESFLNVDECMDKARRCHDHLAALPPPGSQAERHHVLLAHLRSKAEKSLAKRRNPRGPMSAAQAPPNIASRLDTQPNEQHHAMSIHNLNNTSFSPNQAMNITDPFAPPMDQNMAGTGNDGLNDMSMFSAMLTPNSNSDASFQYMLDLGWESLDTIGASSMRGDMYPFGMS
ncbi:hypothetical protein PMZ80_004850 [Knufia obscura]|uniref:Zn(2)-C6 fungal-type domain-containing protein n=2 Tax=Knufia TaxID=430999 RepID=A0AAN8EGA4_9EURO|nr:hypothetical protein PMZ80_004850 [Knufia obscura]KAK5948930.1 hypothetical protein OHC33_010016 [Knufia fluminis]